MGGAADGGFEGSACEQRAAYVAVGESAGDTSLTVGGDERHHAIGETVEPAQGFHKGRRVGNDMR